MKRHQIADLVGSIGAALLIAGYLRYSIQGEMQILSKTLMIAGGVFLVVSAILGFQRILQFFSKRSSQLGTNTTLLALGVLAILVVINFLGYQHKKRFDLTSEKLYTLSDQTKQIVGGLKEDVSIVRFSKTPDPRVDEFMGEYQALGKHVKFQNVDPQEKPDVAKEYGAQHIGDIIVASGARKETLETTPESGIDESDLTSAIMKVTRDKQKTVCFVTGHGEKPITADTQTNSYSIADQGLKKEGYNTQSVNLVSQNGVPSSCDLLVIDGPTQPYFPQETAMIEKYLNDGGKALIEVDPETDPKLDPIFQAWNINVGNNVVIDASGMGRLLGAGPGIPLVVDYGTSPITKNLERHMTFYPLARTVSIADKNKTDPEAVELLKTSPQSFTTPKLEREVKYDAKTDTAGPLSLGVAASRKVGDKSARLVVVGDSDFASNQAIGQASNGDLFYNTVDWLTQDENLISIRPKKTADRQIVLTAAQAAGLKWLDLFFLPGIVILSGIYIWWKRR